MGNTDSGTAPPLFSNIPYLQARNLVSFIVENFGTPEAPPLVQRLQTLDELGRLCLEESIQYPLVEVYIKTAFSKPASVACTQIAKMAKEKAILVLKKKLANSLANSYFGSEASFEGYFQKAVLNNTVLEPLKGLGKEETTRAVLNAVEFFSQYGAFETLLFFRDQIGKSTPFADCLLPIVEGAVEPCFLNAIRIYVEKMQQKAHFFGHLISEQFQQSPATESQSQYLYGLKSSVDVHLGLLRRIENHPESTQQSKQKAREAIDEISKIYEACRQKTVLGDGKEVIRAASASKAQNGNLSKSVFVTPSGIRLSVN